MTVKVEVELPDPPEGYQWDTNPVSGAWWLDGYHTTRFDFKAVPIPRPKVVRYEWTGLFEDPTQEKFDADEWFFIASWAAGEPVQCFYAQKNHGPRWILRRIEEEES